MADDAVVARWRSRALIAEAQLFDAGLSQFDPRQLYPDAAWIVHTLTHKDGSPLHIDELQAARKEVSK